MSVGRGVIVVVVVVVVMPAALLLQLCYKNLGLSHTRACTFLFFHLLSKVMAINTMVFIAMTFVYYVFKFGGYGDYFYWFLHIP